MSDEPDDDSGLLGRLAPRGTLATRTVRSGVWAALMNVADRVLQLVTIVVVARLLSVADFGVMSIALLVMAAVYAFTEIGVNSSLIQHASDDVDEYLDTVWVTKIVRGVFILVGTFLLAPVAGRVFGEPGVVPLIRVVGASPLVASLMNPAMVYLDKDLAFDKRFVLLVSGQLVSAVVAIAIAYRYRSPWALIVAALGRDATKTVVSYYLHDYRPSLSFDLDRAREMISYGKWIFGSSVLTFLFGYGDDAFVAWYLSASVLSYYRIAYRFSNAPTTEITDVVGQVAFPTFSKLQGDTAQLRSAFVRFVQLSTLLAFPAAVGIALVARPFVLAVFGERWLPAVTVMQLLAVWGLAQSIANTVVPLMRAVGRPGAITKLTALQTALLAALIVPATDASGIEGTATAVAAIAVVNIPISFWLAGRTLDASPLDLFRPAIYPAFACLVMSGAVLGLAEVLPAGLGSGVTLAVQVLTGAVVYVSVVLLMEYRLSFGLASLYGLIRDGLSA
jgi:PST family polysaccharide transporter/lipopolysaccharide exporter